jgi:hypothetical protein
MLPKFVSMAMGNDPSQQLEGVENIRRLLSIGMFARSSPVQTFHSDTFILQRAQSSYSAVC